MASTFVDKVTINIIAGDGGDGAVTFHREKYVPAGGPDGGDGGCGGNIVFVVDEHMSTLMDFRYKRKFTAGNGMGGQGKRCTGKDGADVVIKVPRGTVLRDAETGAVMHDMFTGESYVAARGGRGGKGNKHFATPTRQTPNFAKPGKAGERRTILLELRLLADAGLLGFPNVGKSTFLSVVSNAHPKIANYHFTTLFPNLGVVYIDEGVSFVLADVPGIIEGASEGAGLGHEFLRHIERCRVLVHIVDVSGIEGRDPVEDFTAINEELEKYKPELAGRPQLVVANKCELLGEDRENIQRLKDYVEALGYSFFECSAAMSKGTREVVQAVAAELVKLPAPEPFEVDYVAPEPVIGSAEDVTISVDEDGVWTLEGEWLERLMDRVRFSDHESRQYFERVMRDSKMYERMESMGVKNGDTVVMYDLEFEYTD